ncbi:MAG: N-acetyltransferase family protein [Cytophagaceae bacterium]|nr:N-acetyltransferase family protein [Cytophagaceae bacterium]
MLLIQELTPIHAADVLRIYAEGMAAGIATLETSVPTWADWAESHLPHNRFVAVENEIVAGWVALSSVSGRCVFGGVAEVSVYVAEAFRGRGVGLLLLVEVIRASEESGLWTLQASIDALNEASLRLHEKAGFRLVGVRERLGQRLGEWRDIVLLERRSERVGM